MNHQKTHSQVSDGFPRVLELEEARLNVVSVSVREPQVSKIPARRLTDAVGQ